ncbi:MAG TPA: hypothetical protein VFA41_22135 [Ktedonobacteraceae bacterium]|jgi:hypothetical protein|nr:hypothetical protein [Ktedonobacteraceae bacterium]
MFDPYGNTSTNQTSRQYQEYAGSIRDQQRAAYASPSKMGTVAQRPAQPAHPAKPKSTQPRMPKAQALALVKKLKQWLVAASIISFGILSGLAAGHVVSSANNTTTTNKATPTSTQSSSTSSSSSSTSTQNSSSTSQQQGGSNFGSSSSSSQPVSGTHTS